MGGFSGIVEMDSLERILAVVQLMRCYVISLTHALLHCCGQAARCVQGAGECERQGITPVCSEMWQDPKVFDIRFVSLTCDSDLNVSVETGVDIKGFQDVFRFPFCSQIN